MILGNIKEHKGSGLVAFLDILGFSNEILNKWNDKLENPLDKLLELKDHLPVHSDDEMDKYEADKENKAKRLYPCRVQSISDSIIVSFGFDDKPIYGDVILGTISFFDTISVIWRNAIEAGFTIRGAADWGDIFWNDKEIIGPAFIQVYNAEIKIAKSSRVIINSSLNRNLKKVFSEGKTFWNDEILKIVSKDIDGFLTLNPHTLYERDNEEDKAHLMEKIKTLRDTASGMNKEKYTSLLANLNSKQKKLDSSDLGNY
ncbi:MAG: hypothetical protein HWE39_24160 [Oceanospirillaceae bacterium]|nr:hypothetical protein [Oceanospirillaceae bacterium]